MSGAEASLVLGLISSVIAIVDASKKIYDAAADSKGLPEAFREVAGRLPIVRTILWSVGQHITDGKVDEETCKSIKPVVAACKEKAEKLDMLFQKVIPQDGASRLERYINAAKTLGKGGLVESWMKGILEDMQLLASNHTMTATIACQIEDIDKAIEEVSNIEPSIPDSVLHETASTNRNYGVGPMINNSVQGDQFTDTIPSTGEVYEANQQTLSIKPRTPRGIRLLSLDGGGIRGLSTLFVLRSLMRAIDENDPPKPCDVFDMIGGTSTGGIIAIMLGRLRMSVEECIDAYIDISKTVFDKQSKRGWRANLQGRFSSKSLEKAIRTVLQNKHVDTNARLKEKNSDVCRTFVCATNARRSQTVLFRNYEVFGNDYDCTIWEAARATSAASSFFDPIDLGDHTFVDGGIGNSNPINQVLAEASALWSRDTLIRDVACIVSIGNGLGTHHPFGVGSAASSGDTSGIFKVIAAITTDSEKTANEFEAHFPGLPYFRFSVPGSKDSGLREHTNVAEISATTLEYLNERMQSLQRCALQLETRSNRMDVPSLIDSSRAHTTFDPYKNSFMPFSLEHTFPDSGYASSESTSHLDMFQEEFVELIFSHEDFAILLDIAANKMVFPEFQNSFSVLLKQYATALEEAAKNPVEKEAALFIRTRCQHIMKDLWVQVQSMGEEPGAENVDADERSLRESKQTLMHRYLRDFEAATQSQSAEATVSGGHTSTSTNTIPIIGDGWKNLPALEKVRGFLTTNKAFEELLVKFEYVVHGSLLHLAIFSDDETAVSQLVRSGSSIYSKDIHGVSAFSLALDLAQGRCGLHDRHFTVLHDILLEAATLHQPIHVLDASLNRFIPWIQEVPRSSLRPRETIICDSEISKVLDMLQVNIQSRDYPGELLRKFENTVVVTGSEGRFQATTCRVFVEDYHSEIGRAILWAIIEAYCGLKRLSDPIPGGAAHRLGLLAIGLPTLTASHIVFSLDHLSADQRFYAVRIVIWLCKAIRLAPSVPFSDPIMLLSTIQQIDPDCLVKELGHTNKLVAWYRLDRLKELEVTENECWTHLFETSIVAEHQLSDRDWSLARGLEIPFEILVTLSAAHNYVWVDDASKGAHEGSDSNMTGGYILLGFYTALIPIASNEAGNCIQWHFEFSDTHILHPNNLQTLRTCWLPVPDHKLFAKSRCFVGWCWKANVMVGTRDLPNTVEWSDAHSRSRTLHTKGYTATAQAAGNAGPVQFAAQGAQNLEYVTNRQHFAATTAYEKAIVEISRQVALVYDSETQQAWLLPKLSILLHLCHTYFQFFKDANDPAEDPVPFAVASFDGSQAARTAFTDKGATLVTSGIRLEQILVDINVNITDSGRTRELPKGLMLFGSELMDMLSTPGTGSDLAEVKSSPPAEAWIRLVQYADAILVCSKLGQALAPIPDVPLPNRPCDCTYLPKSRCYLAAHIWCLEMMLQRRKCHVKNLRDQVLKINEDTVWCLSGRPFKDCQHNAQEHYWDDNSEEVLQTVSKPRDRVSVTPSIYPIPISGALVFGIPPPKVLKKRGP